VGAAWWLPVDGLVLGVSMHKEGAIRLENDKPITGREIARRATIVLDFALADNRDHRSGGQC
jgi:hypothetical protein